MLSKKERWGLHLVWTAIAAPVLLFLSIRLNNTRFSWLYETLSMPGVELTTWLGGMNGHIPDLGLLLLSEIISYWAWLFVCTAIIEVLINRKSAQA